MSTHLRASLWLLLFTVVICSVLYPLVLWGFGQAAFPHHAAGSLIDKEGNPVTDPAKAVGSRLIAQEFKGDEYFQPRPSHAGKGYEANLSGGSNWGASNYRLRDRVARQLGPIVRYGPGAAKDGKEPGQLVGPDIDQWFRKDRFQGKPGIVAQWAQLHSGLAEDWVKSIGEVVKEQWNQKKPEEAFAAQWRQDFPELYARWQKENPGQQAPSLADLASGFFPSFSAAHPGSWPYLGEEQIKGGPKRKKLYPVQKAGEVSDDQNEIQQVFFDLWRQDHPKVDLLQVPADMVTASGSGLDPHITLKNAFYQAQYRMAEAWAKRIAKERKLDGDKGRLKEIEVRAHKEIAKLAEDLAAAPLGGLAGVRLVNALEANLELRGRMAKLAAAVR
jgi:K+-transporting ATPase ATPase C chain